MRDPIDLPRLESDAARLLEAGREAGAERCDVAASRSFSLEASVREAKLESVERSESERFSLRVFLGAGSASVAARGMDGIDELARRAVAMAKASPEDPFRDLAPEEALASEIPDLDLFDESVPDADSLAESALEAEAAGREVAGVSQCLGAGAGWGISGFVLATSHGFSRGYRSSSHSISAAMAAGEGNEMERDFEYHAAVHREDLESASSVGKRAGERASSRLGSSVAPSGKASILFDRRVSGSLLGALLSAANGAAIARKTSFLRDSMGKQVADCSIEALDDPLRKRGLGSRPFDGEGMACSALKLVEKGRLSEWLLDWASARELGMESNARAVRGGAGTSPAPSNCWIPAGAESRKGMIEGIESGLLVVETIGHGVNVLTGDYSVGAAGFRIEGGKVTSPASGVTVAGNLSDMFMRMRAADDLEFRGSINAPSLLVEGMTVGGS